MRVAGIICEYNPFHNGHAYHIERTRSQTGADAVIAIMSGDFVQRGECAIVDKWKRAKMAIWGGIDLVIELPFCYACNSADIFARGAVDLVKKIGGISTLSFGIDGDTDLDFLIKLAEIDLEGNVKFSQKLTDTMKSGISYATARSEIIAEELGLSKTEQKIASLPNNILAIEYIKHLKASDIRPLGIPRIRAAQDTPDVRYASASQIRRVLLGDAQSKNHSLVEQHFNLARPYLPAHIFSDQKTTVNFAQMDDYLPALRRLVLENNGRGLEEIFSATEGLHNRLIASIRQAQTYAELIAKIKTKRYTQTRIARLVAHSLVGLTKEKMRVCEARGPYARVLAMNSVGQRFLRYIKRNALSHLPVVTNKNKQDESIARHADISGLDSLASDIYHLTGKFFHLGYDDQKCAAQVVD